MSGVNSELKSLSHSKGQNWYHVILVPRARYAVFKYEATKKLCEEGIKQICNNNKIDIFAYEVMPDLCTSLYLVELLLIFLDSQFLHYSRKSLLHIHCDFYQ